MIKKGNIDNPRTFAERGHRNAKIKNNKKWKNKKIIIQRNFIYYII